MRSVPLFPLWVFTAFLQVTAWAAPYHPPQVPDWVDATQCGLALCPDPVDNAVDDGPRIAAVIADMALSGSGTLYFPAGTYNIATGAVFDTPAIRLKLEPGAIFKVQNGSDLTLVQPLDTGA